MGLKITKTVEEVHAMTTRWVEGSAPFTNGWGQMLGAECVWPLMIYCQEFFKDGETAEPLELGKAMETYVNRLEFFVEKAEDERGISAGKAWEQVLSMRWLFGIGEAGDMLVDDLFVDGLELGRKWLDEVKATA